MLQIIWTYFLRWNFQFLIKLLTQHCIRGCIQKFPGWLLERELQIIQLSATRCSCIILWVSLVSFASINLCVASQRVFIVVISLSTQSGNVWIHPRILRLIGNAHIFSNLCCEPDSWQRSQQFSPHISISIAIHVFQIHYKFNTCANSMEFIERNNSHIVKANDIYPVVKFKVKLEHNYKVKVVPVLN
jgi:hypothetical protein